MNRPSGATRVAAVIGDPVEHSLSPVLHNAAFTALGLDWVYVAFRVARGQAASAVEAMRSLDLGGLSVTMPHKAATARAVDSLGPVASRLGVVNTVSWSRSGPEHALIGDSTDGAGFLDALRGDEGFDPEGRRCAVLGAGGAARAVVLALAEAGAAVVTVVGRRQEPVVAAALLAGESGAALVTAPGRPAAGLRETVAEADLVVNATPHGMGGEVDLPLGLHGSWLEPGQFVSDLIYAPATTPLVTAAREAGAATSNGVGMLIHQAARQVELWTGHPAPVEAMSAAAVAALTRREG